MPQSFHRETLKVSAQQAVYDIGKGLLGVLWLKYSPALFSAPWRDHLTPWQASALGLIVALLLPFPILLTVYWRWGRVRTVELHGLVIKGQGFSPTRIDYTLSGEALAELREHWNVAAVCGLNDTTVDKFTETRIAISAPFTITQSDIEISVPLTSTIHDANLAKAQALKDTIVANNPSLPTGISLLVPISLSVWSEMVLMPKGVSTAGITSLAAVRASGGKIISLELQEGRFVQR